MPGAYSEILVTATLQREKLDVLHTASFVNRIPLGYRGKTVVTFHDMSMYNIPECLPTTRYIANKTIAKLMARRADKIIAVSNYLREDLEKFLKVEDEKISLVYSGLDERFFENPDADAAKVLGKLGIGKKYILFLGTLEPSKNIARLLNAFSDFKERQKQKNSDKFDYQLVLAGKEGWRSQEYRQIAKDMGISNDVVFTGYVVGDDLVPLFKNAEFFIMPSLYEGFGMTVLEAFATQTPAIISRVSSLPELAGDAAYYINPLDTEEMTNAMILFAENEDVRSKYKSAGFEQAKKFDWNKCALETLEIYKSLK
jgi:glycosyltransferase involved in cell wall biosynthesis